MSEVLKQAVSLTQAKTLYDDLRGRIENHTVDTATLAEIQLIIDNYGEEEDDGMIIETEWYEGSSVYDRGWVTVLDANAIAEYVKAGKSIIFRIPTTEGSVSYGHVADSYIHLAEYVDEYEAGEKRMNFLISEYLRGDDSGEAVPPATDSLTSVYVNDDGKIYFKLYTD